MPTTKIIDGVAVICSDRYIINDVQSALDLMVSLEYEYKVTKIAINKDAINEEFFDLSTGLAGDVVQKFVNYRRQLAIIGNFSEYTSKSLHDFMYESNIGNHLYFVKDEKAALESLKR